MLFDVGGTTLELLSPEDECKLIGGCGLSLGVVDVWKLWKKFENADNIIFPIQDNTWGDNSFCITDPEGFHITFFTKR